MGKPQTDLLDARVYFLQASLSEKIAFPGCLRRIRFGIAIRHCRIGEEPQMQAWYSLGTRMSRFGAEASPDGVNSIVWDD